MDTPVTQVVAAPTTDKPDKTAVADTVLVDGLSSYFVDFFVKKPKALGADDWVWRQFALRGQRLDVLLNNEVIETFNTSECEMVELSASDNLYQLVRNGEPRLIFFCPSATIRDKFVAIFRHSTTTPYWTKPASTLFDDLVSVANTVLETDATIKTSPVKSADVPPAPVTEQHVLDFINQIEAAYDALPTVNSKVELYEYVKSLEAEYIANPNKKTIVHDVLKLYPDFVQESTTGKHRGLTKKLDVTKCPHCSKPFIPTAQMNLHVGGKTLICDQCDNWVHYETFKLGEMLQQIKSFDFKIGLPLFQTKRSLEMPGIPRDGKARTYMHRLLRVVFEDECITHHRVPYNAKFNLEEKIMGFLNRVDLVQLVYRHILFVCQIHSHANYWKHPKVIEASIHRYNKFRFLTNLPKAPSLAATLDILLAAYAHQVNSTTSVLPIDQGSDNIPVRLGDTAFLWGEQFNEAYSSCALDVEAWIVTKPGNEEIQLRNFRRQWAKYCHVPSLDCRFVGVEESFPVEALQHAPHVANEGTNIALSVIGSLESDERIARGKLRNGFTQDTSRIYTYCYEREVRSLFEKIFAPGWY